MPLEILTCDFPEQFKRHKNIDILTMVFDRQLKAVFDVFSDLQIKRYLENAEGEQLDKIGDIVVLSRSEADDLAAGSLPVSCKENDEAYKQMLVFKILKNTCNCSYEDIQEAISMMWKGPPLTYREDSNYPATMIFEFEAEGGMKEGQFAIPFIKAGGVSLMLKMNKPDNLRLYTGLAVHMSVSTKIDCTVPNDVYLCTEDGGLLSDENGNIFVEEE